MGDTAQPQIVIPRTHTVDIYRKSGASVEEGGNRQLSWSRAVAGVRANIQPKSGTLSPTAAGQEQQYEFRGFMPSDTNVLSDDRLVVTTGWDPGILKVLRVSSFETETPDAAWDLAADLQRTSETIP
jgi:hypothetical protein